MKKLTLEEFKIIAQEREGICHSKTYINCESNLLWECKYGHQWEATPNHIKRGTWCPMCSGNIKLTIEDMMTLAKKKNGICLSSEYINSCTKLLWECQEGHQWWATYSKIKRGTWCPHCAGVIKLNLDIMKKIAIKKGGKCLSKKYTNRQTKLLWECKYGHRWEARPCHIQKNSWCPVCSGKAKKSISDMIIIASERGGKCLSDNYFNHKEKLLWECKYGHRWEAIYSNISRGSWCPLCSSHLGERICREIFEQLFGLQFPKSYPSWLINEFGNQMELDGYCESLKICFEHHGIQHYEMDGYFIKNTNELEKRKKDDLTKQKLCREHGILLFEIPQILIQNNHDSITTINKLKNIISEKCLQNRIELPKDFQKKQINLKKAYTNTNNSKKIIEAKRIAEKYNGSLISDSYINSISKLLWECEYGHRWAAKFNHVKRGSWCPYCAGRHRTIKDMKDIAKKHNGKCLSNKYISAKTKLTWECSEGHQWNAIPDSVIRGSWCRKCANK